PPPTTQYYTHPPPCACNPTATTALYTLSLHDALPIFDPVWESQYGHGLAAARYGVMSRPEASKVPPAPLDPRAELLQRVERKRRDRKSTRLNSSHEWISYAVFCLKKKQEELGPVRRAV